MSRVSYNILPTEGPKQPRDISRIVNQAMTGQQNVVRDITIPAGGLDSGSFTVQDPRVSAQKYIELMPIDVGALLLDQSVFITNIRNGQFDIATYPQELQQAYVTVFSDEVAGGSLLPEARLDLENVGINKNFTVDLVANTVTVLTDGMMLISFTVSGDYVTRGVDFEFGLNVIAGPNTGGRFKVDTSTSNQNSTISVSGTIMAELNDGDVLELYGLADDTGVFTYDLTWSMLTAGEGRGIPLDPGAGPFNFKALIIG